MSFIVMRMSGVQFFGGREPLEALRHIFNHSYCRWLSFRLATRFISPQEEHDGR